MGWGSQGGLPRRSGNSLPEYATHGTHENKKAFLPWPVEFSDLGKTVDGKEGLPKKLAQR